ncbi:MAG: glycosyltransferase family 2 protein [Patescibacteria group bacterium]
MNDTARVSVNIVAWNSMAYLSALLKSLEEQTEPHRIIIVDNASTDGLHRFLSDRPDIATLRNMRNFGFSRAHNQAIQLALSFWKESDLNNRYILVCNPDIEMHPQLLSELVSFMDNHPEIDACAPKLLRAYLKMDDMDQIQTERTMILDAAGMSMTRSRRAYDRGAGEPDRGQYDSIVEVFGISGACSFFRASSLVKIAPDGQVYDEDFHAYKEDVDLAWRMKRLGLKSALFPSAVAWHHRAAPSAPGAGALLAFLRRGKKPAFTNYLSTRNHTWMLVKNLSGSDLLFHGLWILPYEAGKFLAAFASAASLRGYWDALLGLPKILQKRKLLKQKSRLTPKDFRKRVV